MKIAVVAIVKNERPSLLEWLAFHRAVGIQEFIIVDNGSTDGTWSLLKQLRRRGLVKCFRFRTLGGQAPQLDAYQAVLNRYRRRYDALIYIDADEYLTPMAGQESVLPDIEALLADDSVSALALNWACYGTSGQVFHDQGLVPERFTQRGLKDWSPNYQFKSVVKPERVVRFVNPHCVWLKVGRYIDTNGETLATNRVDEKKRFGFSEQVTWSRLRINHYVLKSLEEFLVRKSPVGSAAVAGKVKHKEFFKRHDVNKEQDDVLLPYMPRTREVLAEIAESMGDARLAERLSNACCTVLRGAGRMAAELRRWRLYAIARLKYGPLETRNVEKQNQDNTE